MEEKQSARALDPKKPERMIKGRIEVSDQVNYSGKEMSQLLNGLAIDWPAGKPIGDLPIGMKIILVA